MKQAVSYVRFSSGSQAQGSSVERQRTLFTEWLQNNPMYTESDLSAVDRGLSAYKSKHLEGGLGDLLTAIEDGYISKGDVIVIEAFDRLSREDTSTALERINKIISAGIEIVTLEDGATYSKASLDTPSMFTLISKVQASHEYSKRLSKRVKAGWKSNEEKLKGGIQAKSPNRPSWVDEDGRLIAKEAGMVKQAIELYKKGFGYRAIFHEISESYTDIAPMHEKTIKRWFENESIAGLWRGVKAYEALISMSEYVELLELMRQRAKYGKAEETYLLTGLIKCAECGGSFIFRRQSPRATVKAPKGSNEYKDKGAIVYSNCANYLKRKACKNGQTLPYEVAELVLNKSVNDALVSIAVGIANGILSRKRYSGLVEEKILIEEKVSRLTSLLVDSPDFDQGLRERRKEGIARLKVIEELINASDEASKAANKVRVVLDSDFLIGTPDQIELTRKTQEVLLELEGNIVNFRNALKDYGYKMFVGRGEIRNTENGDVYSIKRRSQKLGGYLIKAVHEVVTDFGDDFEISTQEAEYLAVRKKMDERLDVFGNSTVGSD